MGEGELTCALTLPRIKIYVYVSIQWLISIQLNADALADNAMLGSDCIPDRLWIDLLETGLRADLGAPRIALRNRTRFLPRTRDLRAWILSRRAGDSRYVDYQQDFRKCRRIVVGQSRSCCQCFIYASIDFQIIKNLILYSSNFFFFVIHVSKKLSSLYYLILNFCL